ncbi:MAG: bifunctional precorrin-2 dehydrogenase/sirohydrochlorin ferrochelatase [Planctomycetes bacterium]|nr:bifunctional precorrin-2 dehydrogenase/sirohydrochlorin ferrochelatase [Planctomycetota bacterium]
MSERHFTYPIVLDLAGRRAVVVGGGRVALRKALALAEAGADVTAVAPTFLDAFAGAAGVACVCEAYDARHLAGAAIVIAATDDEAVNRRAAAAARAAGALVNVVDVPALCDFIVPAQVRRGDLVVAVTTGGAAPSLSRRLRERLEAEFGPEWAVYLEALRGARERVLSEGHPPEVRRRIFERLTEPDVLAAARAGPDALRRAVDAAVAEGTSHGCG